MADTKILTLLNELPSTVLSNITSTRSSITRAVDLSKQEIEIFGHKALINPIRKQEIDLDIQAQMVNDWQYAAQKVLLAMNRAGLFPSAIVPAKLFAGIVLDLKLVYYTRQFRFDPYVWDEVIFNEIFDDYPNGVPSVDVIDHPHLYFDSYGDDLVLQEQGIVRSIGRGWPENEVPRILEAIVTRVHNLRNSLHEQGAYFFQRRLTHDTQPCWYSKKAKAHKVVTGYIPRIFQKNFSGKWNMLSKSIGSPVVTMHSEPVPDTFIELFLKIQQTYPQLTVHTVCDPAFIQVTIGEESLGDYIDKKINEHLQPFLKLQKKLNAGMTPMEIRRLYPKSDDPIFYSLYSEQYKGIKHEFAIVWGQFGTSPYEAEAIKRIEAATAQVFAGQQN